MRHRLPIRTVALALTRIAAGRRLRSLGTVLTILAALLVSAGSPAFAEAEDQALARAAAQLASSPLPTKLTPRQLLDRQRDFAAHGHYPPPAPKGASRSAKAQGWVGPYYIYNGSNVWGTHWMVLDADLNTICCNGTKVQIWEPNGNYNQGWYFWDLGNENWLIGGIAGRVLDANLQQAPANGTSVTLWDFNGGANQAWHIYPDFAFNTGRIELYGTTAALDAYGPTYPNRGTKVQLWQRHGGQNQAWFTA